MIEFDVDMSYLLECDELDKVVLNDENGEHEPMEFVPKDAATVGEQVTGDTSDGYHTFNELYHHRATLFSVVVSDHRDIAWKSRRHHDGSMYDGMFIVGVETPWGQATYHYDVDPYWDMFDCKELERAPEWDGHSPDDAIERIGKLATMGDPREGKPFTEYALHVARELADEAFGLLECCDEPDYSAILRIHDACVCIIEAAIRRRFGVPQSEEPVSATIDSLTQRFESE